TYEVGVRGEATERLEYSLALCQARVRDQLIPFPDTLQRVYYQNAGRSIHRGIELGADLAVTAGLNLQAAYTVADYRYDQFRIISVDTTVTPRDTTIHDLHDRSLPGIPRHWLHLIVKARPAWARGTWAELEETHSSSFFVDDTLSMRTSPWWTTSVRLGWDGSLGSVRVRPFGRGAGGAADPAAPPHTVVTNDMLLQAAGSGNWLMYGHNYWNNRFSPLRQINTANVKNLVARAVYTHGSTTLGSFETTPIVVNGIMYITSPATPNNIVRAFDLRTQKMLWQYEHKNASVSTACCGPNNRGVAVAGASVFLGTLDDELVALDATNGKEKWAVKVGDGPEAGYTETMAPVVSGDMVIIGSAGAEYGIRGYVKAYNAATGAPGWTWD